MRDIFERATAPESDPAPLPHAVLVFAHPDDEVVALGSRLKRFQSAHFFHVTDGAPQNEIDSQAHGFRLLGDYREARRKELHQAFERAGLQDATEEWLGISDQDASFHLPDLVQRLRSILSQRRPEVVFTHPYEGGHPDHDACAFAVHQAISLLENAPVVIEAAFYHAGPSGMETGRFLPAPNATRELVYRLNRAERQNKRHLFNCFATQQQVLSCFSLDTERFRITPKYNFQKPPHTPPVFYDGQPWGMTSVHFSELAREAQYSTRVPEVAGACH